MKGSSLGRPGGGGKASSGALVGRLQNAGVTERLKHGMGSRMSWPQIRQSDEYRGRWVALDNCRYDARTAEPVEGTIIDSDDDLVELCTRIRQSENKHCAILFCDETDETPPPSTARRSSYPPTH